MLRRPEFGRIRSALAASSHFQSLDGSDLDRLAQLGRLHHLRHGERAARNGAYEDRFYLILSGAVRVSSQMPGAKEFVFAVLGPGSYFGLATAVRHAAFTADARAFGPTDLAVFPGSSLVELLDERPRLWKHVCGLLSRRLRLALLVLRDNSVAPLPERIARRLLGHALSSDLRGSREIDLRMTQADLALMLGASRARTNAALKALERTGLVRVGYRGIRILDLAALRRLAGPGIHAY
ncbi:MAG TPA: Crp/Fnr family transcriptional regulator [Burkholderiales bacterium]|nr:Crp/Fnr family transcriptional regulator [Burkholderiales bacterium]